MTNTFEIEWKISGLLPAPIAENGKYYQQTEDHNYSKRNFGRPDIPIPASSLVPTKLFHQALSREIRGRYGLDWTPHGLPYRLPIEDLGIHPVNLRFRVFGGTILVLTIQLPPISMPNSITDLIRFEMLSSHPILESVARFCFNVHYCPAPSQMAVEAWQSKPLMKIRAGENQFTNLALASLVTRHEGLDERATLEMLAKNEELNFNDDILLLDKQGVIFLNTTSDRNNQRNRYGRISSLYEYTVHIKSVENILAGGNSESCKRVVGDIESINEILSANVLSQSVSASRGWELIKRELSLSRIGTYSCTDDLKSRSINEKVPFYQTRLFKGIAALLALAASVVVIVQFLSWVLRV